MFFHDNQNKHLCFCAVSFVSVGSELAEPQNVRMVGLNTNYTLKWDWDDALNQDVTFTTEYIA